MQICSKLNEVLQIQNETLQQQIDDLQQHQTGLEIAFEGSQTCVARAEERLTACAHNNENACPHVASPLELEHVIKVKLSKFDGKHA